MKKQLQFGPETDQEKLERMLAMTDEDRLKFMADMIAMNEEGVIEDIKRRMEEPGYNLKRKNSSPEGTK